MLSICNKERYLVCFLIWKSPSSLHSLPLHPKLSLQVQLYCAVIGYGLVPNLGTCVQNISQLLIQILAFIYFSKTSLPFISSMFCFDVFEKLFIYRLPNFILHYHLISNSRHKRRHCRFRSTIYSTCFKIHKAFIYPTTSMSSINYSKN